MTKNLKPYAIIFLLSLSTLSFEIILARIFSYVLAYHFVFIIIAFAILALALGQLYASRLAARDSVSYAKYFIILQLLFPVSIAAIFILPSIESIGSGSVSLILYILLASVTFFLVGIITASIFQSNGDKSRTLYALDLIGAAAGSLLGLFLLNTFSIVQSLALILIVFSIASFISIPLAKSKGFAITTASVVLVSLYLIFLTPNIDISIAKSSDKDLLRLKGNPSVKTTTVESKWNSFGRTDLVEFLSPDSTTSMSMFIDGAAGTQVVSISELEKDEKKLFHTLMHSNMFFEFNFLKDSEKDSALIIGPGGGIDIAAAYFGKTKQIDAVEVNPTFVEFMKKYNKSTFSGKPNINVIVGEGRNFVRNSRNKPAYRTGRYDLIFLTIPITKGGRSTDFVNLTENYLFTEEALEDYLHILTAEGRIVFTTHNREETYKIVSNYLDLQNKSGISNSEASKYFYVADQGMMPLLVIKKTPFTKNEIEQRHFISHQAGFDRGVSFFPFVEQIEIDTVVQGQKIEWNMFDNVLHDVSNNKYDFHELTRKASINLHPVTDNSPFFFNYELGLPDNLNVLIFAGITLLFLSVYMFKKKWGMSINTHKETELSRKNLRTLTIVAFLLGFTYILSESYLFQALNIQLNNPLKSFSLLLFAFLLGNGIGSYLSNFIKKERIRLIGSSVISIILILAVNAFLILPNLEAGVPEFYLFILVFIPAILIGIPFPLLLAEMNEYKIRNGIAVLLSISGIAGFIGSIFTISIAILSGYSFVHYAAGALYVVIIVLAVLSSMQNKQVH